MRVAAGPSVKSALSHTYVLDTRDDRFMATRGFYFRFYHELAGAGINIPVSAPTPDRPAATTRLGLGGDASFYKAETEAQISRPISQGIVSLSVLSLLAKLNLLSLSRWPCDPVYYWAFKENPRCSLIASKSVDQPAFEHLKHSAWVPVTAVSIILFYLSSSLILS